MAISKDFTMEVIIFVASRHPVLGIWKQCLVEWTMKSKTKHFTYLSWTALGTSDTQTLGDQSVGNGTSALGPVNDSRGWRVWLQLVRQCWHSQPATQNHSCDNQQDEQYEVPQRLLRTVGKIRLQYSSLTQANLMEAIRQLRSHSFQVTQVDRHLPVQLGRALLLRAVGDTSCKMYHTYSDKNPIMLMMTFIGSSFYCLHFVKYLYLPFRQWKYLHAR